MQKAQEPLQLLVMRFPKADHDGHDQIVILFIIPHLCGARLPKRAARSLAAFFAPLDPHVPQCHDGRVEHHARAAVAHGFADFFAHRGRVAVRRTRAAECLFLHVRAALDAGAGIAEQRFAVLAKLQAFAVVRSAVDFEHLLDRLHFRPALFLCCHVAHRLPSSQSRWQETSALRPAVCRTTANIIAKSAARNNHFPVEVNNRHLFCYNRVSRQK